MTISSLVRAFATVFPAELPDKTMIASIILVTRYRRPFFVWLGAVSAFTVHVIVAVAAGSLLSLLPETAVALVVTALFAAGAVLLFRAARSAGEEVETDGPRVEATALATVAGSFGLVVIAEWGDLTQLATASLAANSGDPIGTGIGAWLALASVAAIAATFGRQLVARVPIQKVNYAGATVFAALALWTVADLVL